MTVIPGPRPFLSGLAGSLLPALFMVACGALPEDAEDGPVEGPSGPVSSSSPDGGGGMERPVPGPDEPTPTEPETPVGPTENPGNGADELRLRLLAEAVPPTVPDPLPDYARDLRPAFAQTGLIDSYDNTPVLNPIRNEGAFLGRVLFYDRLLSENGEVACASCHLQSAAFTDPRAMSEGFERERTRRNSMSLVNLRFYEPGRMFWDERSQTLEDQVLAPIQDPVEMGIDLDELVLRVSSAAYYVPLFDAAFGSTEVTSDRIARALAQFVRSMVSFDSRWDKGVAQVQSLSDDFPNFTASENRGKALFFGIGRPDLRGSCGTCHLRQNELAPPPPGMGPNPGADNRAVFFMDRPRNNGLPDRTGDDGFAEATGSGRDEGAFKSPSLRNVALTAPYMHDGRFRTLEEVINFYDRGIAPHPNLDPALRGPGGMPLRFRLPPPDRADLVAFLRTLTGRDLVESGRFSSPFPE